MSRKYIDYTLISLFKEMREHIPPHMQAIEDTIAKDLLQKHYSTQYIKGFRRDMEEIVKEHIAESGEGFLTALLAIEKLKTMRRIY